MTYKPISNDIIDPLLDVYDVHYLKGAERDGNIVRGHFVIDHSPYLIDGATSGHLNAVDLPLCINQLMFAAAGDMVKEGNYQPLAHVSFERFLDKQYTNALIANMDMRFRREVPCQNLDGIIDIGRLRKVGDSTFFPGKFNFGNGGVTGSFNMLFNSR